MKHHLGLSLQFIALVFLPLLVIRQLATGFRLIWMPVLLVAASIVFWVGTKLRESS